MRINLDIFKRFFQSSVSGSILLLCCVVVSLLIANSAWGISFERFLSMEWGFETASLHLRYTTNSWINDGLMAVFFLLVGLEIKRELVEGELSTPKRAVLPIFAAIGGAIVPAVIYWLFNKGTGTAHGWGIPMATDIAFALGVLSLLGKKVPASLKIFLSALAIVDDLLAILVIALFYTQEIHGLYLLYAGGVVALLVTFNLLGLKNLLFYLVPGVFLWYFVHHSGIHATIAGVLTAMTIPTNKGDEPSPLEKLEHVLARPVNVIIMPLFALANTNIRFEANMVDGLFSDPGAGIALGLLLGKPVGIFLSAWLVVKARLGALPSAAGWRHIWGLGLLGGIGFTMSIFIALLSFDTPQLQSTAKFCTLFASTVSALFGFAFLFWTGRKGTLQPVL